MQEHGPILESDEEAILEIFKVRQIGKGVGLTREVLASELKWISSADLDAALGGLLAKGLLSNPSFYQKIFILTPAGKEHIDAHLSPF